jgi:hypothetical protein
VSEMFPEQPGPAQPGPLALTRYICLACGAQFSALIAGGVPPHTRSTPVSMVSGSRFQIDCEGSGGTPAVRTEELTLPADPWAQQPDPGGVAPVPVPETRLGEVTKAATAAAMACPQWREGDRLIVIAINPGDTAGRTLSFSDMLPEAAAQELHNAAAVMLASHPGPWRYVIGKVCSN